MSVKVKYNIPKDLGKRLATEINEAIKDPKLLLDSAEISRKDIIVSILKAQEPTTGKPFSNPTITQEWRDRKRELSSSNNPLDGKSGGGSSAARLAFTGQFLRSFKVLKVLASKSSFFIGPVGKRTKYKGVRGQSLGGKAPPSNEKLGQFLVDQGRDWRGVTERSVKRINNLVRTFVRRKLKDFNKK